MILLRVRKIGILLYKQTAADVKMLHFGEESLKAFNLLENYVPKNFSYPNLKRVYILCKTLDF